MVIMLFQDFLGIMYCQTFKAMHLHHPENEKGGVRIGMILPREIGLRRFSSQKPGLLKFNI